MENPTKKNKRTVAIASAFIGLFVGILGFKGFVSGNPEDFIYFFFFIFLFYLKEIDKRLSYLGILGIIGIIFAVLVINEVIVL
jgi:hypothetical protein